MSPSRGGLRAVVLLCLAGAGLVLIGCSVAWVSVEAPDVVRTSIVKQSVDGAELAPGLRGLGWLGATAVVALVALRGLSRRALGALLVLDGAVAGVEAARWLSGSRLEDAGAEVLLGCTGLCLASSEQLAALTLHRFGVLAALLGAVLVLVAGVLTVARGHTWQGLGSSYEAPGGRAPEPVTDKGLWDALDRGDDPTA